MTDEQENAFWETMHVMERLGIIRNVMIIGSWAEYPCEITAHDTSKKATTLIVPEPVAYAVQKILTNPTRMPPEKKAKDIEAIRELLYHIKQSDYHKTVLNQVCYGLSKRQSRSLQDICVENRICL